MKRDKPAYPSEGTNVTGLERGMTRREVFAKAAMEGILASPDSQDPPFKFSSALVATAAVNYADALIAELDKEEGNHDTA